MKKMIKIILFCLIFVILFGEVYRVLSWKDTAGDYYSSMDSFYQLEENTVDVLFLGSSHCYCSINNALLWDNYGMSSFNLAISGQDLASTYYCFKEALKTQKPKVVCVEVYGALNAGYVVKGNLYRNTLPFKASWNAYQAIDSMVEEDEMSYFLKWPIVHTRYRELKKEDFDKDLPVYLGYHAEFQTQHVGELLPYNGDEVIPIDKELEEWIHKIIQLAEESDTELCFFMSPSTASKEEQKKYKYVEKMAIEKGIPFLNFIELESQLGLDPATDFIDGMHTNYFGAEKVTAYMGDFLWSKYELSGHYGDEKYAKWEENSQVRTHELINHLLKQTSELREYLKQILTMQDYTIIFSVNGEVDAEYLKSLGVSDTMSNQGGIAIIENGETTYVNTATEFVQSFDLGGSDLRVLSSNGQKSIVVDMQERCKVANGINIVIYDQKIEKLVDVVGFDASQQYMAMR